jgi:hypothetical protein
MGARCGGAGAGAPCSVCGAERLLDDALAAALAALAAAAHAALVQPAAPAAAAADDDAAAAEQAQAEANQAARAARLGGGGGPTGVVIQWLLYEGGEWAGRGALTSGWLRCLRLPHTYVLLGGEGHAWGSGSAASMGNPVMLH